LGLSITIPIHVILNTLWQFNIDIESCPFIVDVAINMVDLFLAMLIYQRVYTTITPTIFHMAFWMVFTKIVDFPSFLKNLHGEARDFPAISAMFFKEVSQDSPEMLGHCGITPIIQS
jgi:hypothetical protein